MPISIDTDTLPNILDAAHIPAISYACVQPGEPGELGFVTESIALGKKSVQAAAAENDMVGDDTRFPASSLSKIVFTYLVLALVQDGKIDLDEPLHKILEYDRFLIAGEYPDKAKILTARHVLSHTTGLPNWDSDLSSTLAFKSDVDLGEGYSYSGEAFLYLQRVIEKKMGQDLEELAKQYVFRPLGMTRSTFLEQPETDPNIVKVHTQLGKPVEILKILPEAHCAASLLTTANDFSKFISAWLESMDDPLIQAAFKPTNTDDFMTCGLGWHIYTNKDNGEVIAYQYGANPNTKSFVAINMKERSGAAFFTNSDNGMSLATQVLSSEKLPYIGNLHGLFKYMHFEQSDEPGWKDTIDGKIAEEQGDFDTARGHFESALALSPDNEDRKRCLEWFNAVHPTSSEQKAFTLPLETFVGTYGHADGADISIHNGNLVCERYGEKTTLVRVSDTEFLPEKDQTFQISFDTNQMKTCFLQGFEILSERIDQTKPFRAQLESMRPGSAAAEGSDFTPKKN
jgi:CubicO group peptidase (beta-lactamase class C family)